MARAQLASPRAAQTLEAVRSATGGWDVDAYHVMEKRDESLIADELLHGHMSDSFIYRFPIQGKEVIGISVVGARHLAAHYGGIKHRLVSSVRKRGALFVFTTFPQEGVPMQVTSAILNDLADEGDFYGCVVEVSDIKSGNTIQIEAIENRWETNSQGRQYERPHYAKIAQSKGFRNAVLSLLPQDTIIQWRQEVMKLGKGVTITASVIDEKRGAVLRFAAKQGLLIDRRAVEDLTLDQIAGLGDAARSEDQLAFVNAARALQLDVNLGGGEEEDGTRDVHQPPPQGLPPDPALQRRAVDDQLAQQKRRGRPPKAQPPAQEQLAGDNAGLMGAGSEPPADPQTADANGATHPASTEGSQERTAGDGQNSQAGPGPTATTPASRSEPAKPSRGAMLEFC
jgi:hypothetical protein